MPYPLGWNQVTVVKKDAEAISPTRLGKVSTHILFSTRACRSLDNLDLQIPMLPDASVLSLYARAPLLCTMVVAKGVGWESLVGTDMPIEAGFFANSGSLL